MRTGIQGTTFWQQEESAGLDVYQSLFPPTSYESAILAEGVHSGRACSGDQNNISLYDGSSPPRVRVSDLKIFICSSAKSFHCEPQLIRRFGSKNVWLKPFF